MGMNNVRGVAHTIYVRVVRTDGHTDGRTNGEVQILMPTHNCVGCHNKYNMNAIRFLSVKKSLVVRTFLS